MPAVITIETDYIEVVTTTKQLRDIMALLTKQINN